MKRITLENIYEALVHDRYEVTVARTSPSAPAPPCSA